MTTRFRSVRDSVVTDHFPDVSRRQSSFLKRFLVAMTISSGAMLVVGGGAALAADEFDAEAAVTSLATATNLLWVVLGAALVIFMQAGFALVETGFCRAKHASHVVATNFAIFGLGFVGFFFVGFPLAFGGFSYSAFGLNAPIGGSLIGSGEWVFLWKGGWALSGGGITPALIGFFLYMVAFMDTVATIPTGSMAERWKWGSFVIWGFFCGAVYYPLMAAWTWGGGWLSQTWSSMNLGAGYVDFAGSGVVHAVGGVAAFAGAKVLGARIGKFDKDGNPRAIPGHHIPMAMLGTFILLFGWFGFNAASTFAATDVQFAVVATNTAIAGAFGAVVAMFWITKRTGKPDPGMMANGMLAGLVAITAPCAFVAPWAAAVIGSIAAILVIESVFFVERKLKLDDPVGAISVHGVGGLFGVLCVGIFSNGSYGAGWNLSDSEGVEGIIKGNWGQLGAQALAVAVIIVFNGGLAYTFFKVQDIVSKRMGKGGIRSKAEDEISGLDLPEMGVYAYPEFVKS
ncbi:MAG: ammonium transporter [Acidimicrobiales bacterium mtb01]|nr:ammonium transporter [Actinomycetota bacterium]TEX46524.1 MAG: ammonium transporter [Acidimicrobiales bacterium mtb01]